MKESTIDLGGGKPSPIWRPDAFNSAQLDWHIANVGDDKLPFLHCFTTFEGEGPFVGTPRMLVRLAGCAVGCKWCDSVFTWKLPPPEKIVKVEEVCDAVRAEYQQNGVLKVSITGGEPMHYPKQLYQLAITLRQIGFILHLETSGLIVCPDVFTWFSTIGMDIKPPSSGVVLDDQNKELLIHCAKEIEGAYFKCVIQDENDLEWLEKNFIVKHNWHPNPIILTPENQGGELDTQSLNRIVSAIKEWVGKSWYIAGAVRLVPQMHKIMDIDIQEC